MLTDSGRRGPASGTGAGGAPTRRGSPPGGGRAGGGGSGWSGGPGGWSGSGPGPAGRDGSGRLARWARTEGAAGPSSGAVGPADGPATWALALLTVASAAGLFRVFTGRSWVGPVVATVAVTHLALWAMRRWRFGQLLAAPVALAVVALMIVWTVFAPATTMGFPGPHAWAELGRALGRLGNDFSTMVTPVAPTRGFEVLAAGGAGLVAVLGDWAAFRWRSPLVAVLVGVAAFVACSAAGQGGGRVWTIGAEVAAICVFLLVERATATGGQVWFAGVRSGTGRWVAVVGAAAGAMALVTAMALTPALASRDGVGALGWRSGTGSGGERIVPNPIVSLRTRLIQYANTPVFAVDSTVPSYWRLTSLNTFNGETWTSTGAYRSFGQRLPGTASPTPGARPVRATFQIQQLDSVWLPEQFNPVSVQGVHHVSYDPGSGSLITSSATSNGLSYTVGSVQYLDTLTPAALEAAPPVGDPAALSADLELPAVVDGPITQLADRLTAGQKTEYAKALAIQDYLRGPQFSYTLDPPSDGSGTSALYNFLFVTRQGYCQQFAGAYAVLARAAGLPTRLAVGFATGEALAGGGYQVYDRDAHTWPEVYFGPRYGWIPFEPTPGFSIPGTSGYTGTAQPGGAASAPTPTTVPAGSSASTPAPHRASTATTVPPTPTTAPLAGPRPARSGFPGWIAALLAVPAAVVLWAAANVGSREALRRRRRHQAEQAGPAAVIRYLWDEACADLTWLGITREPAETDDEFARRASHLLRVLGRPAPAADDGPGGDDGEGGLLGLAGLARRAAFSASTPPELVARARASAGRVRRQARGGSTASERLRRWVSLPPGQVAQLVRLLRSG